MKITLNQFLELTDEQLIKKIPAEYRDAFPGKLNCWGPLEYPNEPVESFYPPGFYLWGGLRYNFLTGKADFAG